MDTSNLIKYNVKTLFLILTMAFTANNLVFAANPDSQLPKNLRINITNVQKLYQVVQEPKGNIAMVNTQGGPTTNLMVEELGELKTFLGRDIGLITVHQIQTLYHGGKTLAYTGYALYDAAKKSTAVAITNTIDDNLTPQVAQITNNLLQVPLDYASRKINRGDFDLHYKIYGDAGPFIVLLSGGPGAEVSYMEPFIVPFINNYRVVLLEQRGTGRSTLKSYTSANINLQAYIDDLEALRKDLQLEKLNLIGNSWGMMLALAYAGTYPDNTQSVITVGSGYTKASWNQEFSKIIQARLSKDESSQLQAYMRDGNFAEGMKLLLLVYFYDKSKIADFLHFSDPATSPINTQVGAAFQNELSTFDLTQKLKSIRAPTLLIQGEYDIFPPEMILEAQKLIKNSKVEIPQNVGHFAWFEKPQLIFGLVDRFLNTAK